MTALDDVIARGVALVHDGRCPACAVTGTDTTLEPEQPAAFHYHGQVIVDPPYLWCPVDGQGYRVHGNPDAPQLGILPPCNGGLHPDGTVGFR